MSDFYILDENHAIIPTDLHTWAAFFENMSNRRVAQDEVDGFRVSTIFLGNDHRFGDPGPPLIFETMVFHGDLNELYVDRYSTWEEALAGHEKAKEKVQRGEIVSDDAGSSTSSAED